MKESKANIGTTGAERKAPRKTSKPPAQSASSGGAVRATSTQMLERRKNPRISDVPPPPAPPPKLEDYEPIIGRPDLDELYVLAQKLKGKTLKMVNSTAVGGGVAEILNRLVPMLNELDVVTKWEVITGGNDFFDVTKSFHNALHGEEYTLTEQAKQVFMMHNEQNRQRMKFDEDLVVIHDPQPVGLIASKPDSHAKWIWRCHIDLSNPNAGVWEFLKPWVEKYDASIFSSPAFARQLSIPQYLFYPCIDP